MNLDAVNMGIVTNEVERLDASMALTWSLGHALARQYPEASGLARRRAAALEWQFWVCMHTTLFGDDGTTN